MSVATMPASGTPLVRQGRPFDNAYCVLSLFEREHGVRVAAYNSETLSETELLLPWDVVSANVGHVNSKTPMERKRPAFDKLLSRIVLEKGVDGSTQLRLTAAPSGTATRRAGDGISPSATAASQIPQPLQQSSMDSTVGSQLDMSTQSSFLSAKAPVGASPAPLGRPRTAERTSMPRTQSLPDGGLSPVRSSRRPVPAHTPSKTLMSPLKRTAASETSSAKPHSPSKMLIGGYVPPTDLASIPDEIVFQAKRMLYPESSEQLATFLREPASKLAAQKLGIDLSTMRPRVLESFKEGPLDTAQVLEIKLKYYEKARVENLSLILAERATAEQKLLEEQRKREEQELKLSAGFLESLNKLKKKLDVSEALKKKVLEAGNRENEIMRKKREEFEHSLEAFERRAQHIRDMKVKQKEQLEYKGQLKTVKILTVQQQRDQNEQRRLDEIRAKEEERRQRMGHQRELLLAGQEDKARRVAERTRMREEKRKQAEEEIEMKRSSLLATLKDKTETIEEAKQRQKEEMAARRIEKWVASRAKLAAAERVRKEREFRLLAQKRKIEMDARKMEALADMKVAMFEERVAKKREERIEFDKWREETVFLRAITPGPGEYQVPSFLDAKSKGGVMERAKASSMLDQVVKHAKRVPGPANYDTAHSTLVSQGGVIGAAPVKGLMDEVVERAARLPGVGEYDTVLPEGIKGASSFGVSKGGSMTDQAVRHAQSIPAPGDYNRELLPRPKVTLDELKSKFSRAKTKLRAATKFIMRTEQLAASAFLRDLDKRNQLRDSLASDSKLSTDEVDSSSSPSVGNHFLARAASNMLRRDAP